MKYKPSDKDKKSIKMDKKILLSTLWIFLVVNFIFCDVFGLHHAEYLKDILSGGSTEPVSEDLNK